MIDSLSLLAAWEVRSNVPHLSFYFWLCHGVVKAVFRGVQSFELAVECSSTGLRICEKCREVIQSIYLQLIVVA